MGAAAILTLYPAFLVVSLMLMGGFVSSPGEVIIMGLIGVTAAAGIVGLLVVERDEEPGREIV